MSERPQNYVKMVAVRKYGILWEFGVNGAYTILIVRSRFDSYSFHKNPDTALYPAWGWFGAWRNW